MCDNFKKGYEVALLDTGAIGAAAYMNEYCNHVNQSIDNLVKALNSYEVNDRGVKQLKGNVFEAWHANSYNLDETLKSFNMRSIFKETKLSAIQDKSNQFASADITTDFGLYGAKNYATPRLSGFKQAISYQQYYELARASSSNPNFPSIEEYYIGKGIYDVSSKLNDPIYKNQYRLIPSDQLDEALTILRKKALKEAEARPEQSYRYLDTYNKLVDRIKGPNNTESIPLTEEQSRQLTQAIKDGTFQPEDYGLVLDELLEMEYVLKQSMNAALTAATLTLTLAISRKMIKFILEYLKNEGISVDDFVTSGVEVFSVSGQAFIRGYFAGFLTAEIKKGGFGSVIQSTDPVLIGTIVTVLFDIASKSIKLAKGSLTQAEFNYECTRTVFIASIGLGGAGLLQSAIPIPFIGALIGNLVGSLIGALAYDYSNLVFLSFCAKTGFSFLGFVDQDYELPDEVLKELGLDFSLFDTCEYDSSKSDICEPDECEYDSGFPDLINSYVLKRGVIGVNKIGFIFN